MKARLLVACLVVLSLAAGLAGPAAGAAQAPDAAPQPPPLPHAWQGAPGPAGGAPGAQGLEEPRGALPGRVPAVAPEATGGPDDYGYTWNDTVSFAWVAGTTNTGLHSNCGSEAAVPIGFSFKYYENTYTTVYASYHGSLHLQQESGCDWPRALPSPATPNNTIAPYWGDFQSSTGQVLYKQGGTSPNRTLAVEWRNMVDSHDAGSSYTFEALLYENGDVYFAYQSMGYGSDWSCAGTGIEDSTGTDGLEYQSCAEIPGGKAVRFYRPAASAHVKIWPLFHGSFGHPGGTTTFQVPVRNTGELGADTYDLSWSSAWTLSLFAQDGASLLTDTDGDGVVDTGPVAQGSTFTLVAAMDVPTGAAAGDDNGALLTAQSSRNTAKSQTARLQAAVPAPFAQVYQDNADGAMRLELVQPVAGAVRKAAPDGTYGYYMAVAETPGGFAYAWTEFSSADDAYELWYALYDRYGQEARAAMRLTDLPGTTGYSENGSPALAVTPNGRIGVLWVRYLFDYGSSEYNYNTWFAILDPWGNVTQGPTNLTNNMVWGQRGDDFLPDMGSPTLAATGDNRFVAAWAQEYQVEAAWVEDVYYAVYSSSGIPVKPVTQFTSATPGGDSNWFPNLAALSGARALLSWECSADLCYAVLDSGGGVVKSQTNLTGDGWDSEDWQPDAVQLSGGRTLVAWSGESYPEYQVRYALLDNAFNPTFGPVTLDNPAALTGNGYVSAAADAADHAILTWSDYSQAHNLYYALLNGSGGADTTPTAFHTNAADYVYTSYTGFSNTSWSWLAPPGVDGYAALGAIPGGTPGSTVVLEARYGNHGATTAAGAALSLALDPALSYLGDTSGIVPVVSGHRVTWSLPDQEYLAGGSFLVQVGIPGGAEYGTRYPVVLELTSDGPEANPADNTDSGEVMAASPLFLPLVVRVR